MAKQFCDEETIIGVVQIGDKERRTVKLCKLNDKEHVVVMKELYVKKEWKIITSAWFPKDSFKEISDLANNFIMEESK